MEVANKLIDDICNAMITDVEDREAIHIAVKQCEAMGFVGIHELMQMTDRGLPIVSTYSTILRIPKQEGAKRIQDREMSFSDLLCVIAIIAQDMMRMAQISTRSIFYS